MQQLLWVRWLDTLRTNNEWSVVYCKAVQDDGSLLFPERLTKDFLDRARRTMGSYIFANQYQNEIIPSGEQTFQKHWLKYFVELPDELLTFCFVDPAISEADTADYTGFIVVSTDVNQNWYVRYASRQKINPSQIIEHCFKINEQFKPAIIGIEDVAFQRSVVHFAYEEMKRRGKQIPLTGVKRGTDKTKDMRILSLVPRFEWGSLFIAQGLHDLELELAQFPRGAHDDLIDSLASINDIAYYPQKPRSRNANPQPNDPGYEAWYIKTKLGNARKYTDD